MLQPLEMSCAQKLMWQKLSGQLSKHKILLTETNLKELGGAIILEVADQLEEDGK